MFRALLPCASYEKRYATHTAQHTAQHTAHTRPNTRPIHGKHTAHTRHTHGTPTATPTEQGCCIVGQKYRKVRRGEGGSGRRGTKRAGDGGARFSRLADDAMPEGDAGVVVDFSNLDTGSDDDVEVDF